MPRPLESKQKLNTAAVEMRMRNLGIHSRPALARRIKLSERTLSRWLNSGVTPQQLQQLAEALECNSNVLIDGQATDLLAYTRSLDEIQEIESEITKKGGGTAIVACFPFKESNDGGMLDYMMSEIRSGLQVRYFYATSDIRSLLLVDKNDPMLASVGCLFHELCVTFQDRVSAYFFHNEKGQLVTFATILIIFFSDLKSPIPKDVFQYTPCSDSSGTSSAEVWLRLKSDSDVGQYKAIWERLISSCEPAPWLGLYQNRLQSDVQGDYRSLMSDSDFVQLYARLRRHSATSGGERRDMYACLANEVGSHWERLQQRVASQIRILDVGIGDGATSCRAIASILKKAGVTVRTHVDWQAVESARVRSLSRLETCFCRNEKPDEPIYPDEQPAQEAFEKLLRFERIDFSRHLRPFEEFISTTRFDLILMIHSMYLIDLSYLKKALYLLDDDGILVIVMSPLKDNLMNKVCSLVDVRLERYHPKPTPDDDKEIGDHFRNYAEDVKAYLRRELRTEPAVHELHADLPVSDGVLDEKYITEAIRYFVGRLHFQDSDFNEVRREVCEEFEVNLTGGGRRETTEWLMIVKKRDLLDKFDVWKTAFG